MRESAHRTVLCGTAAENLCLVSSVYCAFGFI